MKEKIQDLWEDFSDFFKEYVLGWLIFLFFVVSFYWYFTETINERGFLGVDKNGRQIFIQSLDDYLGKDIIVSSEWDNYNFLERYWQEPMRTTLSIKAKINTNSDNLEKINREKQISDLKKSYKMYMKNINKIYLSEDYSVSKKEIEKDADNLGVVSFKDFLRGLGFKKYEYYLNGELIYEVELNNKVKNSIQGNFSSSIGSQKNIK